MLLTDLMVMATLALSAVAHPKLTKRELEEHHADNRHTVEALTRCLQTRELEDVTARIEKDRRATLAMLRKKRDLSSEPGK